MQFDRADIPMNKLVVTTLESRFRVYDMRTMNSDAGYAFLSEKAHNSTVWIARHLPQNRDLFATGGGNGTLNLYQYAYPEKRRIKNELRRITDGGHRDGFVLTEAAQVRPGPGRGRYANLPEQAEGRRPADCVAGLERVQVGPVRPDRTRPDHEDHHRHETRPVLIRSPSFRNDTTVGQRHRHVPDGHNTLTLLAPGGRLEPWTAYASETDVPGLSGGLGRARQFSGLVLEDMHVGVTRDRARYSSR